MGNKSLARRQRDAFKKVNNGWDDLQRMYVNNQSQLNEMVGGITAFLNIPGTEAFLSPQEQVHKARALNAFNTDVKNFQMRLTELYSRHKHMSGQIKTGEFDKEGSPSSDAFADYNKAVMCYEAYEGYRNDFNRIVLPVHRDVIAIISTCTQRIHAQAEKDRKAREEAAAKQDAGAVAEKEEG